MPEGTVANKFIPESTAGEMLGRKTTWFWKMRTDGKLKYRKIGNKVYYALADIEKLFNHEEGGEYNDQ